MIKERMILDLTDRQIVLALLRKHGLWAEKRLGQNFLICRDVLDEIVAAADLKSDDVVLEVGPGLGVLTVELCKQAGKVVAIEKDKRLVEILRETMAEYKNVEIIESDIFKFRVKDSGGLLRSNLRNGISRPDLGTRIPGYKVVANIPYYLTSHLIQHFLQSENPPQLMVLMVQKEVAQRIAARPPKMELLSVLVQFYGDAEIVRLVPRSCFWPIPEVDSAIVKITISDKRLAISKNPKDFFRLVKAGFTGKRKTLLNALSGGLRMPKREVEEVLKKVEIDPQRRAETLSVDEWINLNNQLT